MALTSRHEPVHRQNVPKSSRIRCPRPDGQVIVATTVKPARAPRLNPAHEPLIGPDTATITCPSGHDQPQPTTGTTSGPPPRGIGPGVGSTNLWA